MVRATPEAEPIEIKESWLSRIPGIGPYLDYFRAKVLEFIWKEFDVKGVYLDNGIKAGLVYATFVLIFAAILGPFILYALTLPKSLVILSCLLGGLIVGALTGRKTAIFLYSLLGALFGAIVAFCGNVGVAIVGLILIYGLAWMFVAPDTSKRGVEMKVFGDIVVWSVLSAMILVYSLAYVLGPVQTFLMKILGVSPAMSLFDQVITLYTASSLVVKSAIGGTFTMIGVPVFPTVAAAAIFPALSRFIQTAVADLEALFGGYKEEKK